MKLDRLYAEWTRYIFLFAFFSDDNAGIEGRREWDTLSPTARFKPHDLLRTKDNIHDRQGI